MRPAECHGRNDAAAKNFLSIPQEGQHFAAGYRTSPLEKRLCMKGAILLPCEVHTKWVAVNDLEVTNPAFRRPLFVIWLSGNSSHLPAGEQYYCQAPPSNVLPIPLCLAAEQAALLRLEHASHRPQCTVCHNAQTGP